MQQTAQLKKVKLPIVTERFLSVILRVLGSKTEITNRELSNIEKFLNILDQEYYANLDTTLDALLISLKILTQFRIKNKEDEYNPDSILLEIQSALSSQYYKEPLENIIYPLLKDSFNKKYSYDISFINSEIYNYLTYGKVIMHKDELVSSSNNISTASGQEMKTEISNFQDLINKFQEFFREIESNNYQNQMIYSSENNFFDRLKESHEKSKSPSYVLKTGLKIFNQMLSVRDGVLPGLLIFYANINNFKSGLLEYFVKWFHLYNYETFKKIKRKTGKKPVILFGSFENSQQEDFERFIKIYTNKDLFTFIKFEDVEEAWKQSIEQASGIKYEDLNDVLEIVYYYPTNTVRVSDLIKICNQLTDQGYKIAACIFDYLEKIKPEVDDLKAKSDMYLLGKVSEGLLSLSKQFDCPVITAGQINRAGASVLYDQKEKGNTNAVNNLNTTYIGKDFDIEKPATFTAFIDKETDKLSNLEYLSVKKAKQRGERTKIETFSHEIKNGIIIEDDINLPKSTSKLAITPPSQENMAFHISQNATTNGKRGSLMVGHLDASKETKIPNAPISLKDIAKNVIKVLGRSAMDYLLYQRPEDYKITISNIQNKNIISHQGRSYIKTQKYTYRNIKIK